MKLLESILQDVSYALRTMRRTPMLTAAAILSLGLGIGANTVIFSLIDAIMLRNLPVKSPQELVQLAWGQDGKWPDRFVDSTSGRGIPMGGVNTRLPFSYDTFRQIRDRTTTLSGVMGRYHLYQPAIIIAGGRADTANADLVTGNFFDVLGVAPATGRLLADADDREESAPTVVLSHAYWVRRFAADPEIAGKTMAINGTVFTITGVAAEGFQGVEVGNSVDLYVPLHTQPLMSPSRPSADLRRQPEYWWVEIVGRRRAGVSESTMRAELDTLFRQSLTPIGSAPVKPEDYPAFVTGAAAQGQSGLRYRFAKPLTVLMTIVGFVLLIGCANVANLLMARAVARRKEMAMRHALGATSARLFRQMIAESVLLAILGGAAGLAIARWGTLGLLRIFFGEQEALSAQINTEVLAFVIGVSVLVGLIFGLAPAIQSARVDLNTMLKGTLSDSARRFGTGRVLVAMQVAVSLALLIGAGLYIRTLWNLRHVAVGFNPDNVLLFRIAPKRAGYDSERMQQLLDRTSASMRTIPGVRAVTYTQLPLLAGVVSNGNINIPGRSDVPKDSPYFLDVGADFFTTTQLSLTAGRAIDERDRKGAPLVAVVNEHFARKFFRTVAPMGAQFGRGRDTKTLYEIVGIVKDSKYESVAKDTHDIVYLAYAQRTDTENEATFSIRTEGDPRALISAVRGAMRSIDPNLPLFGVSTQAAQLDATIRDQRLMAGLAGGFGALALVLAAVGMYGVIAYSVTRKTPEIGIRMALGAGRRRVLGQVLSESLLPVGVGIIVGLGVAWNATKFIASQLYGLDPRDTSTMIAAAVLIALVAIAATLIPARRASRVDPMTALRHE
jgi:predicted permease